METDWQKDSSSFLEELKTVAELCQHSFGTQSLSQRCPALVMCCSKEGMFHLAFLMDEAAGW